LRSGVLDLSRSIESDLFDFEPERHAQNDITEAFRPVRSFDRELSVAVRKLQAVAPRDPVMPVADGFFG